MNEKHKARGLRVMAVTEVDADDMADDKADVLEAAREHDIDYPCLLDGDAAWMRSAGIEGVPTFLVIDRAGKIVYRYRGGVSPDSPAFDELAGAVQRALGE